MESIIKLNIFIILIFASSLTMAEDLYIKSIFQNSYETTKMLKPVDVLSCGQKIHSIRGSSDYIEIKKGKEKNYLPSMSVSKDKGICIQDLYPEFFFQLNLSYRDLYYWAKLSEVIKSAK